MDMKPEELLHPTGKGLYCPPGDFYVDPVSRVDRAVITHGHADHARAGHRHVLATQATLDIMKVRYGDEFALSWQAAPYGTRQSINGVTITLVPAGHVLGSAQAVIEQGGTRIVVSGDYKRRHDPTCPPFEPVSCDIFISEATFGLPVFIHPPDTDELNKLLQSLQTFPDRTHLVGAYALGKAQRIICSLRALGYDAPVFIHGALEKLCTLYTEHGIDLGPIPLAKSVSKEDLRGQIVVAPPSALNDRWSRRLADPLTVFASGWMRVRARAKQRRVELPLIISDHADWEELTTTLKDVDPGALWVTHGREDALVHYAQTQGYAAKPLNLVGYEEDDDASVLDKGVAAE